MAAQRKTGALGWAQRHVARMNETTTRCDRHQLMYRGPECPYCRNEKDDNVIGVIYKQWWEMTRYENVKLRECIKQFIANWDLWGASIHGLADHSDKQLVDATNEILDVARDLVKS